MSIRKEFEKLVKEANRKLEIQNQIKEAAESIAIEELNKRQQMLINILSKNNSSNHLQPEYNE